MEFVKSVEVRYNLMGLTESQMVTIRKALEGDDFDIDETNLAEELYIFISSHLSGE